MCSVFTWWRCKFPLSVLDSSCSSQCQSRSTETKPETAGLVVLAWQMALASCQLAASAVRWRRVRRRTRRSRLMWLRSWWFLRFVWLKSARYLANVLFRSWKSGIKQVRSLQLWSMPLLHCFYSSCRMSFFILPNPGNRCVKWAHEPGSN